jgi:hypothetical protein
VVLQSFVLFKQRQSVPCKITHSPANASADKIRADPRFSSVSSLNSSVYRLLLIDTPITAVNYGCKVSRCAHEACRSVNKCESDSLRVPVR